MVMGYKIDEVKAYLELGHNIKDFVLLDVEGEILLYDTLNPIHYDFIKRYKERVIKLI